MEGMVRAGLFLWGFIFSATAGLCQQTISGQQSLPYRCGVNGGHMVQCLQSLGGISMAGLEFFDGANGEFPRTWKEPLRNLLLQSENLTITWTEVGGGSIDDATHFTFVAQNDRLRQTVSLPDGMQATFYARVRSVTGNVALRLYHGGLTPAVTTFTSTGTLADYVANITGDGGNIDWGIQDPNAGGFGQIEVPRWAVIPGTHTAAEAALLYQTTGDGQSGKDFSGNNRHPQYGPTAGMDTGDPADTVTRLALGDPAGDQDVTDASWTKTNSTANSATLLTFDAQNGLVSQDITTVAGVNYTMACTLSAVTGNTALHWLHTNSATGNSTARVVTASATRYSVTVLGRAGGGAVSFGVQDQNAAGHGQISIDECHVEVGDKADDGIPSDFTVASTWGVPGRDFDGTDDYMKVSSDAISPNLITVLVVVKLDAYTNNPRLLARLNEDYAFNVENGSSDKLRWRLREADGTTHNIFSNAAAPLQQWFVAAGTYDGTTQVIYIDGVAQTDTATWTDTIRLSSGATFIGADDGLASGWLDGQIAHVLVYNRAMSAAEVTRTTKYLARTDCDNRNILCQVEATLIAQGWTRELMEWATTGFTRPEAWQDRLWDQTADRLWQIRQWEARQRPRVEVGR